ncbi:proline-rich protein 2-like [Elephas maximus indicus]|uniref:proline-rich protein 2-like n=1 Tax=Elephas maximus indicus TaxID=99487 RepID=UPI002116DC4E|nr:proline-rich protein 2-like [Elephas maximus indicus]
MSWKRKGKHPLERPGAELPPRPPSRPQRPPARSALPRWVPARLPAPPRQDEPPEGPFARPLRGLGQWALPAAPRALPLATPAGGPELGTWCPAIVGGGLPSPQPQARRPRFLSARGRPGPTGSGNQEVPGRLGSGASAQLGVQARPGPAVWVPVAELNVGPEGGSTLRGPRRPGGPELRPLPSPHPTRSIHLPRRGGISAAGGAPRSPFLVLSPPPPPPAPGLSMRRQLE